MPIDALTPIPNNESSISMVNFLISFFLTRRLILLYSTDGLIPSNKSVGDVKTEGLKTIKKRMIDNQCAGRLAPSDWMVIRATETGATLDSGWKTWRASVRTKCNSMQTQIDNASNVDALAALFERNENGVRPLGDFPVKE